MSAKELNDLRKLRTRRGRHEQNRFLVEGARCVRELLLSGWKYDKILFCENMLSKTGQEFREEFAKTPMHKLTASKFRSLGDEKSSQGLMAVVPIPSKIHRIGDNAELLLALERISDPSNLGSIIRSAAAFNVPLLIGEGSADIFSPKVISSCSGYLFKIFFEISDNLAARLTGLKKDGRVVWGADAKGVPLSRCSALPPKLALVIGNEAHGLSSDVRPLLDELVGLSISPQVESLSAPVAAGIMLYALQSANGQAI